MSKPTTVKAPGSSRNNPNYVISAVILHDLPYLNRETGLTASEPHMLGGVRTEVDPRHQGVFSSITMSVPRAIFTGIFNNPDGWEPEKITNLSNGKREYHLGVGDHARSVGTLAIEGMLSRKAGLGDAITAGTFRATAERTFGIARSVPDASTGHDSYDIMGALAITNLSLTGVEAIPERSAAYDPLVWVLATSVPEALRSGDALMLETKDGLQLSVLTCAGVGGSCMRLAAETIQWHLGEQAVLLDASRTAQSQTSPAA